MRSVGRSVGFGPRRKERDSREEKNGWRGGGRGEREREREREEKKKRKKKVKEIRERRKGGEGMDGLRQRSPEGAAEPEFYTVV